MNGWAREDKRVPAASPQAAALQKELDEVSRALRYSNSEVLARYGGYANTVARYRELKDILAKPEPHYIRIDTFQIWRSRRIYPYGAHVYEAPGPVDGRKPLRRDATTDAGVSGYGAVLIDRQPRYRYFATAPRSAFAPAE